MGDRPGVCYRWRDRGFCPGKDTGRCNFTHFARDKNSGPAPTPTHHRFTQKAVKLTGGNGASNDDEVEDTTDIILAPWGETRKKSDMRALKLDVPQSVYKLSTERNCNDKTRPKYGFVVVPEECVNSWQRLACLLHAGDGVEITLKQMIERMNVEKPSMPQMLDPLGANETIGNEQGPGADMMKAFCEAMERNAKASNDALIGAFKSTFGEISQKLEGGPGVLSRKKQRKDGDDDVHMEPLDDAGAGGEEPADFASLLHARALQQKRAKRSQEDVMSFLTPLSDQVTTHLESIMRMMSGNHDEKSFDNQLYCEKIKMAIDHVKATPGLTRKQSFANRKRALIAALTDKRSEGLYEKVNIKHVDHAAGLVKAYAAEIGNGNGTVDKLADEVKVEKAASIQQRFEEVFELIIWYVAVDTTWREASEKNEGSNDAAPG